MKIAKGVKKKGGGIFMEYLFKLTSLGISLSRKFKRAKSMKTGQRQAVTETIRWKSAQITSRNTLLSLKIAWRHGCTWSKGW